MSDVVQYDLGSGPGTGAQGGIGGFGGAGDLGTFWASRAKFYGAAHTDMDVIVNTYFGETPQAFKDYFHKDMHVHVVNMIRLAWDDLANLAGKIFQVFVETDNDSDAAKA